jgi:hypothetical protein
MLYPPNTANWARGCIVIHHADAKEPKMLMRVIGRTRAGLIKTQYIDRRRKRTVWVNDFKNLLNPRDFGLAASDIGQEYLEIYQDNWERMRRWNRNHPQIGVRIQVTYRNEVIETVTTTHAQMVGLDAWVYAEKGGAWCLEGVTAIPESVR